MDKIRKKKSRIFLVVFLLSTFILTSNAAFAFEEKGLQDGMHGKGKRDEVVSKMNLTPKQKKEIIETQEIQKNQLGKLRRALRRKRSDLADELGKDKLNFDDIKDVTDDIKDLQGQLIDNRISHFVRMKKILSKEQMSELLDSYKRKN